MAMRVPAAPQISSPVCSTVGNTVAVLSMAVGGTKLGEVDCAAAAAMASSPVLAFDGEPVAGTPSR
jgi:hypothetical protein